jgi:Outer membrane protein beta-barrel domain
MRASTMVLALSIVAAPVRAADDPYRIKVLVGGGYQLSSQTFTQTISFDQYQETAAITNTYTVDKAPGFDLGLQVDVFKHIGFSAAATVYSRDLKAAYEASFPHPLFFDQARMATGEIAGKQKETAGHLGVVAFGRSGPVELSAWAGVSFFKVHADLLQSLVYTQSYPYDSVTVTSTPTATVSDSPTGFNIGGSADWRFSKRVGAGVQARYAHAKAKLSVPNAPDVEADAGGFQIGAGLRVYF